MARNLSFWFLIALVVAVGFLFFRVIQPFVLTLFLAIILAVLFAPTHQWVTNRIRGHDRIAAVLTTLIVLLLVLLPITITLLMAGTQVMEGGKQVLAWLSEQTASPLEDSIEKLEETVVGKKLQNAYMSLPDEQKAYIGESASKLVEGATSGLYNNTQNLIANLFAFVIGVAIMSMSLYYFLADRDLFVQELQKMLPLEWREERQLTDQFQTLCRGVVFGTIAAGLAQAVLAGIAFAVIGVPQLWLLIVLTMFCSFIPFVGSAIVWIGVVLLLLVNQNYAAAIGLTVYGTLVIGSADNLVRAYVIGSQTRLHPLVALVTVLGAIELIGLWGIFIGPMVAAFFYALMNIVRDRVEKLPEQPATLQDQVSAPNPAPPRSLQTVELDMA